MILNSFKELKPYYYFFVFVYIAIFSLKIPIMIKKYQKGFCTNFSLLF
ncbi:hypothetical protein HPSA50_0158 [Helicobacter pylori SouthAfrica50]|uniref:Uncharacterized protein n=1 Tax=Helicobacter pylori SouthAfrica50 TaxID=1352357 RepID=T2SAM5_HELPX|nr:hypothetical protein HPSA50_0158 [Helicobacter pylori SouthAfrica50]